ncbi:hypothetical protein FRB90_000026 [Tulasnella sp. 427]|nr:hypothetical protein FRB90_000026 [Tulasnella sp. 427]
MSSTVSRLDPLLNPLSVTLPGRRVLPPMDPPLKASDDHEDERVQFSYFTHFDEYQRGFNRFLEIVEDAAQADEAYNLYRRLALILDRYQEQSYLLDPFLERMLIPPLQKFKERAKRVVEGKVSVNGKVWQGLPALIYHLIKTRGAKTAVRFFPHTPADLNVALDYLATDEAATPMSWETRYIVLLWLSLVAMLPFDLAQFDRGNAGSTFTRLENAGKNNLEKAGLEREGAALLLTRLYARKDYQGSGALYMFMVWGMTRLIGSDDPFRALGVLHVLCETTKTGSGGQTAEVVYMHSVLKIINESDTLTSNTLVRKWATKLESRLGLCKLPPPKPRKPKGKLLQPALGLFGVEDAPEAQLEEDIDVPDSLDDNLDSLLKALQDRDTVVRWVAAKGLARVAERLPDEYVSQILEAVIELYSTYAFDGSEGSKPLLPISEPTWHGATLACAEFARRGLIGSQHLPVLMGWLKRALHYDPVKITGPVGSNVRDAACYVLWAMARAQDKDSFEPYSLEMARHLVTVSVFDREVHVRRAASAAFQEHVGRTGLFPHGIDTVRKADFFAVSMRRSAFTIAAPQVAEHEEYRGFLINHLITVSLTHTDAAMRQPAAVALRRICEHDLLTLGPTCVPRVAGYLQGSVAFHVHGALLALAELADAYKQSKDPSAEVQRLKIFEYIVNTPSSMFLRWRHGFLLQAACIGLSHSLSNEALAITDVKTPWKDIVWAGIKYRGEGVPEAAAVAMRAASQLVNCNPDLQR